MPITPDYQSGENVKFKFTPAGGAETEYPAESIKWTDGGPIHDHSNARDGRTRVKGMDDFKGTATMPFDPATPRLRRGTKGTAKVYLSPTQFDSIPIMVTAVDYTGSLDDGYKMTVDFEQSGGTATIYDSAE